MPEQLRLTKGGVRLRKGPGTDSAILIDDLGGGTVVTALTDHAWRNVKLADGTTGWIAQTYLEPAPPNEQEGFADRQYTLQELWPLIKDAAREYGCDPYIVAGIIRQESGFKNFLVHRDGTGHGLAGLDDNGMLPDFEHWSGLSVGRGSSASAIPIKPQIDYLAHALADAASRYGDLWAACRWWHRGQNLMDDAAGKNYETLIRVHASWVWGQVGN